MWTLASGSTPFLIEDFSGQLLPEGEETKIRQPSGTLHERRRDFLPILRTEVPFTRRGRTLGIIFRGGISFVYLVPSLGLDVK